MTDLLTVPIVRIDPELPLPAYAHDGDAGADLYARYSVHLCPKDRILVPTGIAVGIPDGYVGLIHPRSGLAIKKGLTVLNTPGTVDAGYRGEVCVCLINNGKDAVTVERGERIAQIVFQRVARAVFQVHESLPETARGSGGHGSTGMGYLP